MTGRLVQLVHRNPGKRSSAGKPRSGLRTNRPHTFHSHQCSGHFRVLSSADVSTPLRGKRCRRGRARTSCTEISQPACHRQHGITVEAIRLLLHAVYRRIVPERSLVRAPRIELFQCQLFPTIDSAGPGKAQRGLRPLGLFESLLDRRQLAQPVVKAVTTRGVSHVVRRASAWERTHSRARQHEPACCCLLAFKSALVLSSDRQPRPPDECISTWDLNRHGCRGTTTTTRA